MRSSQMVATRGWAAGRSALERVTRGQRPASGTTTTSIWSAEASTPPSPAAITQVLHQVGVPFATFDAQGQCTELSDMAALLLGDGADRVCRLGAQLLAPLLTGEPGAGDVSEVVSAMGPEGAHQLRGQRLPAGDPRRVGLLLILPVRETSVELDGSRWGLTRREAEVAALITGGASSRDAATLLGISVHTVRRHTERIFTKLGVCRRGQVVAMLGAARRPHAGLLRTS